MTRRVEMLLMKAGGSGRPARGDRTRHLTGREAQAPGTSHRVRRHDTTRSTSWLRDRPQRDVRPPSASTTSSPSAAAGSASKWQRNHQSSASRSRRVASPSAATVPGTRAARHASPSSSAGPAHPQDHLPAVAQHQPAVAVEHGPVSRRVRQRRDQWPAIECPPPGQAKRQRLARLDDLGHGLHRRHGVVALGQRLNADPAMRTVKA